MLLECLYYRVFLDKGEEVVAVSGTDRKVVSCNTDGTLIDVVNFTGLNNICAVYAHKLRLRQAFLYHLHCHERHYGTLVLNMQLQIVLYTFYIQELA